MKKAQITLRTIGIISIIFAVLGLTYNLTTFVNLIGEYASDTFSKPDRSHAMLTYTIMSIFCVCCYVALMVCGIWFIRLKTGVIKLFIFVLIAEVIFYFATLAISIPFVMYNPEWSTKILIASAQSSAGLMWQMFSLFPVWASILAVWATRQLAS